MMRSLCDAHKCCAVSLDSRLPSSSCLLIHSFVSSHPRLSGLPTRAAFTQQRTPAILYFFSAQSRLHSLEEAERCSHFKS